MRLSSPVQQPGLKRRMLICVFLGFSSGLPLYVLQTMLQVWLAKAGLNIKLLGLLTLATFPYTWKFLWAPLMDSLHFGRIGRRRGWMGLTQIGLLLSIGAMGLVDPLPNLKLISLLACVIAFCSASQDIAIDAYRRELLTDNEQGLGSAIFVNAYRISSLVPGALALILSDHLPWSTVFWITAAFMLPGLLCSAAIREPVIYGAAPLSLRQAVLEPFSEFVQRFGWAGAGWVLLFVVLYKLGDSMSTAIASIFYVKLGFTLTEIGSVTKLVSLWANIAGAVIGGIWIIRLGINRSLWIFGVIQAVTILGFLLLVSSGPDVTTLALVIAAEAFGAGIGTTAYIAFIARTTNPLYAATQMALLTSLSAVPRTFVNASTGYIVSAVGWSNFYLICFALSIPGMLLLHKVAPWRDNADTAKAGQ